MYRQSFLLENLEINRESRKFLMNLDEASTNVALDNAVSKMYEFAVTKYNKLDLETIPDSKGDIIKFTGYKIMTETLDSLDRCFKVSNATSFPDLVTVQTALRYLERNKMEFSKGFISNNSMIIMIYNSLTYGIVASINLLIAEWVDYSKLPNNVSKIIRSNKTEKSVKDQYLLLKGIEDFNKACEKGTMGKFLVQANKNKDKFIGVLGSALAMTTIAILGTAIFIVPFIREVIFSVYNIRMKLSQYLEDQANFIKINAETLNNVSDLPALERKRVKEKQLEASKKLQKLADKIVVKFDDADKKSKKEISKKLNVNDIRDNLDTTIGEPTDSGFLL